MPIDAKHILALVAIIASCISLGLNIAMLINDTKKHKK